MHSGRIAQQALYRFTVMAAAMGQETRAIRLSPFCANALLLVLETTAETIQ